MKRWGSKQVARKWRAIFLGSAAVYALAFPALAQQAATPENTAPAGQPPVVESDQPSETVVITGLRTELLGTATTSSQGIILIDTIYPYNSEELIVEGMRKVGLDPKDIKYLIVSHAHQDHIGGAEMIQTRYRSRVAMSAPDWDLVEKVPNRFKTMAPKRDIVSIDGPYGYEPYALNLCAISL